MAFGERVSLLDRQPPRLGQRLHRLHAAEVRTGEDRRDWKVLQQPDQVFSLLETLLAQGALAIVSAPIAAAPSFRVPDHIKRAHQAIRASRREDAYGRVTSIPSANPSGPSRRQFPPARSARPRQMRGAPSPSPRAATPAL